MAISGSHGSAVLTNDRDNLEFESVPEFIREPRSSSARTHSRDSYVSKSCYIDDEDTGHEKSAEIETLWPGISADLLHNPQSKKQPLIYLSVGFMAGLFTALVGMFAVFAVTGAINGNQAAHNGNAKIVVAQGNSSSSNSLRNGISSESSVVVTTKTTPTGGPDVILPIFNSYTVKSGDTLAGIALQAYKRATPRLMDEICRANGMKNANVLSLGQTLVLPEYRPLKQVAAGTNTSVQ